jgi:hypothetical protein
MTNALNHMSECVQLHEPSEMREIMFRYFIFVERNNSIWDDPSVLVCSCLDALRHPFLCGPRWRVVPSMDIIRWGLGSTVVRITEEYIYGQPQVMATFESNFLISFSSASILNRSALFYFCRLHGNPVSDAYLETLWYSSFFEQSKLSFTESFSSSLLQTAIDFQSFSCTNLAWVLQLLNNNHVF